EHCREKLTISCGTRKKFLSKLARHVSVTRTITSIAGLFRFAPPTPPLSAILFPAFAFTNLSHWPGKPTPRLHATQETQSPARWLGYVFDLLVAGTCNRTRLHVHAI